MFESPRWIEASNLSFNAHIKLDTDGAFYHPDLKACNELEPMMQVLSFDRVTTCSYKDNRWHSHSEELQCTWYEVALRITIWVVAWMLLIPAIVFISLKVCYVEKVKEIAKGAYLTDLREGLQAAKREGDVSEIFMKKMDIVAETIRDAPSYDRVVIKDVGNKDFECFTKCEFFMNYLPDAAVAYLAKEDWQEENRNTMQFFLDHFGEERATRIFQMVGVDVTYYQEHGFALSRKDVANFFALTSFVHIDDMKLIFEELKKAKVAELGYLHLDQHQVSLIVKKFEEKEFDALSKKQYDLLWDVLTPLSISTMFVDKPESRMQTDQDRGCDLPSMIKALWIEQTHLRWRPDMKQREFDYTLIKSLVGAFHEHNHVSLKGKVIRQQKGYGVIQPMIAAAGCYCIPVEALGATRREIYTDKRNSEGKLKEDTYLSRLLFLPTQGFARFVPRTWESIAGVFQKNMGAKGVLAIWPRLEKLFAKPAFNRVDMIGYSQGGAQAAMAATMALKDGHVRKLTKVCSPANDEATAELFAELVRERGKVTPKDRYVIKVNTIWQSADRAHMAEKREVSMNAVQEDLSRKNPLVKHKIHWYSTPKEVEERSGEMPHKLEAPVSSIQVIWEAFAAVWGAHGDDMTMDDEYIDSVISTTSQRDTVLSQLDNEPFHWEPVREEVINWVGYQTPSDYFAKQARNMLRMNPV